MDTLAVVAATRRGTFRRGCGSQGPPQTIAAIGPATERERDLAAFHPDCRTIGTALRQQIQALLWQGDTALGAHRHHHGQDGSVLLSDCRCASHSASARNAGNYFRHSNLGRARSRYQLRGGDQPIEIFDNNRRVINCPSVAPGLLPLCTCAGFLGAWYVGIRAISPAPPESTS
jgi:hypothetical protein